MHYKSIIYAAIVASLSIPTVGSRTENRSSTDRVLFKQCVEGSAPLEQIVGDTTYIKVKEGNPQKALYFIPNVHWQGDEQRD